MVETKLLFLKLINSQLLSFWFCGLGIYLDLLKYNVDVKTELTEKYTYCAEFR